MHALHRQLPARAARCVHACVHGHNCMHCWERRARRTDGGLPLATKKYASSNTTSSARAPVGVVRQNSNWAYCTSALRVQVRAHVHMHKGRAHYVHVGAGQRWGTGTRR